jgi:hypothetical protein
MNDNAASPHETALDVRHPGLLVVRLTGLGFASPPRHTYCAYLHYRSPHPRPHLWPLARLFLEAVIHCTCGCSPWCCFLAPSSARAPGPSAVFAAGDWVEEERMDMRKGCRSCALVLYDHGGILYCTCMIICICSPSIFVYNHTYPPLLVL